MSRIEERLAQLSPEQKAALLKKLSRRTASRPGGETEGREYQPPPVGTAFSCRLSSDFKRLDYCPRESASPGPGQISIRARAAALNFRDLMIAMGLYPPTPGVPSNMGSDYAGIVTACGPGVDDFKPGDEVMALSAGDFSPEGELLGDCHFSSRPLISARQAALKPANLSFAEAAALPTVFLTAYYSLVYLGRLAAGETVLIHSATGGLGHAALAVAAHLGARILASAGSPERRAYLKKRPEIFAVLDSRSVDYVEQTLALTGGRGVDVILNTLAGDLGLQGLECLDYFGRFIQVDKRDIAEERPLPLTAFKRGLTFAAVDVALFLRRPELLRKLFTELRELFENASLPTPPIEVLPLQRLGEALALMSRMKHTGKLVLEYP